MPTETLVYQIDATLETVRIGGNAQWRNVEGGFFLARSTTPYEIILPYRGTPFDPEFVPPSTFDNGFALLEGTASVAIGNPKFDSGVETATGLRFGLVNNPGATGGVWSAGLAIEGFQRAYQAGRLDGDQTFAFAFRMDPAFGEITEILIGYEVRMPVAGGILLPIGTDAYTTETYAGEAVFAEPIRTNAPARPGPFPAPEPQPDPEPEPVVEAQTFLGQSAPTSHFGGDGLDTVDYSASPVGVQVNLEAGTGRRGHAAGDSYVSIERVVGSDDADVLWGNDADNVLEGGAGNDFLRAGGGDNRLFGGPGDDAMIAGPGANLFDGGTGVDEVRYVRSTAGVTVDLGAGTGSGGWAEGDRLVSVENLVGSVHDDVLIGSPDQNILQGLAGDDVLIAVAGDNFLFGGAGADRLVAGTGNDRMRGGADADTFVFGPDHGFNIIRDFQRQLDRIEIVGEDGPASFDDLTIATARFGTRIDYAETRILLENVFRTDLVTESLFDFV